MPVVAPPITKVPNFINGAWVESHASEWLDVTNPATGETIAQTPLSNAAEVAVCRGSRCRCLSRLAPHAA